MNVVTNDLDALEFSIRRMRELVEADPRVRAAWLQGSFARGDQDPWSDVDFYTAVDDAAFDGFVGDMREHLDHLAPVVGALPAQSFGRTRLIAATLDTPEGLVRFDFFAEPASAIESPRPVQPLVLFDRDGLAARFAVGPLVSAEALQRMVARMVQGYFFGAMWPVRLAGRSEAGTLWMNAAFVLFQFVAPAMLVRSAPQDASRAMHHLEHHLPPEDRARFGALVADLHRAFTGVGEGATDGAALKAAHLRLFDAAVAELHAACDAVGVEWPARSEAAYRAYYARELGGA